MSINHEELEAMADGERERTFAAKPQTVAEFKGESPYLDALSGAMEWMREIEAAYQNGDTDVKALYHSIRGVLAAWDSRPPLAEVSIDKARGG